MACEALILILISTTLISLCLGQNYYKNPNWIYEATAKFSRFAEGHITVINGHVMVDLDITNVSSYQGTEIPTDCFKNGAYLHIHDDWNNNEDTDYITDDNCNEDQTGDHFDPWFACSIKSGENSCGENGGCIRKSRYILSNTTIIYPYTQRDFANEYSMEYIASLAMKQEEDIGVIWINIPITSILMHVRLVIWASMNQRWIYSPIKSRKHIQVYGN